MDRSHSGSAENLLANLRGFERFAEQKAPFPFDYEHRPLEDEEEVLRAGVDAFVSAPSPSGKGKERMFVDTSRTSRTCVHSAPQHSTTILTPETLTRLTFLRPLLCVASFRAP